MKKLVSVLIFIALFAYPTTAHAVCPLCTITVGAGLGISRWIGIDDSVTGLWIGGLIISSGLWMADWINKKKWRVPYSKIVSVLLFYLFVIPPLYVANMIGINGNTLWGIDKVLLGTFVGSVVFIIGVIIDKWLRTTNDDKVYIYYQKVIVPVLLLSIASLFFYLITI